MTFEPTEQQARAIRCLDRPLAITAGAGSGKTRVLAERLAAAVGTPATPDGWEPADIGDALIVTFTDKAAGEIAERARRVLLEHGLVAQARRVDEAWISTIHGLCQRILRAHALDAGLDPGFAVIPTVEAGALREAVFERLLRDDLASGAVADLVGEYGAAAVEEQAGLLHDLLRAMGATPDDVTTQDGEEPVSVLADVRTAVADWSATLASWPSRTTTLDRVTGSVASARQALEDLASGAAVDGADLARETLRLLLHVKLLKNVGGAKDLVEAIAEERAHLLDRAVRAVTAPLERSLLGLTRRFGDAYTAAKRDRGVLDFEDLQLLAVSLLGDDAGPAQDYRALFRLVMIDEFQDTNEVQTRLADLLSSGNLCTVGDERQSIYAFRFADVDVYRRHTDGMLAAGAETARLADNFRSHPDVLAFVNAAFADPGLFGPTFLPLRHGRKEPEEGADSGEPRVEMLFIGRSGPGAALARAAEADAVGRRVRELVNGGVGQGDIVMLLRAMTHADTYADALRLHGLEATIVAGGAFLGRPEVEAARALLRAMANPLDDEALALVLASPVTGLSPDGLIRLRHEAERRHLWEAAGSARLGSPDAEALARTKRAIEGGRARQGRSPIAEILHRACEETDFDLRLLASGPEGRRAYANVLKLARLAEEFERAGGCGIPAFLQHLTLKERFADREAPAPVLDERVEAVRIMTIHAAKGLEFPVVVVPELGRDQKSPGGRIVLEKDGAGARLALALTGGDGSAAPERRSRWMSEALERAKARETEEEKRLLYVACTRARERLVLSGAGAMSGVRDDRPLGWIRDALGIDERAFEAGFVDLDGCRMAVRALDGVVEPPAPEQAPPEPRTVEPAAAHSAESTDVALVDASPATPPFVSYSGMRSYRTCPLRYHATSVIRLGRVAKPTATDPLRLGDAVHAALRLVGADGTPPSDDRLTAIARQWVLPGEQEARLRRAVAAFTASNLCRNAYARGAVAHEVAFAVPITGAILVGKLDLVAERDGGAVVVDYKTGAGAGDDDERREQADCYALAMLASGAREVDVTFVDVETGGPGEEPRTRTFSYTGQDEPRLRDAIDRLAASLVSGPYEPLSAYEPSACDECPAARNICPVKVPTKRGR